ncbi:MAG: phenylalanine--tRNA ligase subunit alpha [Gammaproteobacteria bacterium]|nr:phenylalanine--tRNA ligase subunit alpha [Gammaproteobacteria bacterium]
MSIEITSLLSSFKKELANCNSNNDLMKIKSNYLGKKGLLTELFSQMKNLELDEKKTKGALLNQTKISIESLLNAKSKELDSFNSTDNEIDISLPARGYTIGSHHPITITINEITNILNKYGFSISDGPEIEDDYYNFEALNIPKNHPARDMHDTFYINNEKLLRTHTSSVQIRSMLEQSPPLRIMTPGKVYRCDSDPTHSPMFHQIEGLSVEKNINFCHLKGFLTEFIKEFFDDKKIEIRFRPSYFPFTEPSAEIDIQFKNKWLEVLGCGMVHPNVLRNVKIDHKIFSGFAFGLGIERFAMLKYGISDLREFFENDLSFLSQFESIR